MKSANKRTGEKRDRKNNFVKARSISSDERLEKKRGKGGGVQPIVSDLDDSNGPALNKKEDGS